LLFAGEHCDLELADEVRRREEEGGQADIKSNNPYRGEKLLKPGTYQRIL